MVAALLLVGVDVDAVKAGQQQQKGQDGNDCGTETGTVSVFRKG